MDGCATSWWRSEEIDSRHSAVRFASPVVALVVGHLLFAEPVGTRKVAGAIVLFAAAALAMMPKGALDKPHH